MSEILTIPVPEMEVVSAGYPLRPEIVESAFYLYQYTNDGKYLQMGKTFLMIS